MIDYGLKDKVVIITGINNPQGIGATTAIAFAKQGAKIAMMYKKMSSPYDESLTALDGLDRYNKARNGDSKIVEAEIAKLTSDYFIIEGDVGNEANVQSFIEQTIATFGDLNILINNAAAHSDQDTIFTVSKEEMDEVYDTNIKGTLMMTREFVKHCKSCGRVINISTDAAQTFATQISYGSSKAAIEALTRAIAIEVGHLGITVNCVAPGPTQTGYIDKEFEDRLLPEIPLGRLGLPQDIADAILFLSSDKAGWLTGQVIKVSGGHEI